MEYIKVSTMGLTESTSFIRPNRLAFKTKEIIPGKLKCYNPCRNIKLRIATLSIKEADKHVALQHVT